MVKVSLGSARGRASSGSTVLGLALSHWLGCSIEPATDFTAFGHTGMVVQETTVRESEETEEVWEAEGAVATGEESIEQVWSEYRALYSFEGQEGEVSLERGERLLVSSEDAPDGLAVS